MKAEIARAGRRAICPYYVKKYCGVLSCEPVIPNAIECNMLFEGGEIEEHFAAFCATYRWSKCPHAKALNEIKYKDDKK